MCVCVIILSKEYFNRIECAYCVCVCVHTINVLSIGFGLLKSVSLHAATEALGYTILAELKTRSSYTLTIT